MLHLEYKIINKMQCTPFQPIHQREVWPNGVQEVSTPHPLQPHQPK